MTIGDRSELEKAEEGLYRPDVVPRTRPRAKLHRDHRPVPTRWSSSEKKTKTDARTQRAIPQSLFSKIFIGSIIFFVIAVAVAIVTILTNGNVSSRRINLEVLGRTFVDGGETLPLQVVVGNNNTTQIELADVLIEYPTTTGVERIRRSIGTIPARQQTVQDFSLTLFGEEGTVVPMDITLEYRIPDSNAILTKKTDYSVTLRSTPIVLTVLGPQGTLPNQDVTVQYTVVSNSASLVEDVAFVGEYPPGFEFKSAVPEPSFSNNVWVLGDLEPGSTRTIAVTGTVRGAQGETLAFKGNVGRQDPRDEKRVGTTFVTAAYPLALDAPFLTADLSVNGSSGSEVSVAPADDIEVRVAWRNPLSATITNAVVSVVLDGAFDPNQIRPSGGFYDSATRTVSWSSDTVSGMASIAPGASGEFSFRMRSVLASTQGQAVTDPQIRLRTNIAGVVEGGQVRSAQSVDEMTVKIASDFRILGEVQHVTGSLVNTGPMPPRVGQQTTYTIALSATNSSSAVTDGVAVMILPQYVTWLNIVAPQQSPITYNPTTRTVTWNVGSVEAGAGYAKPAKQVSFKVGITPSLSQVDDAPTLVSDIVLTGNDAFTKATLRATRGALSTRLLNESSTVGSDGRVVQ